MNGINANWPLSLFRELMEDGYTAEEIEALLKALRQNASQWPSDSLQWANYMSAQLRALIDRSRAMTFWQYKTLRSLGYADKEIRLALSDNQTSLAQLVLNTQQTQRQAVLLEQNGYTSMEVHRMLLSGFTVHNMQTIVDRVIKAKKYGTDQYGLTPEQIYGLLFGGKDSYGQPTSGIVTSLLSGNNGKIREGSVARCVLDWVTTFDRPIGPRGLTTQIDVGTQHYVIEVKVDSVGTGYLRQVRTLLAANPDKGVLLYARGYQQSAAQTVVNTTLGRARVVRSCADLRNTITAQGGP
jgi:hypothetical protein